MKTESKNPSEDLPAIKKRINTELFIDAGNRGFICKREKRIGSR